LALPQRALVAAVGVATGIDAALATLELRLPRYRLSRALFRPGSSLFGDDFKQMAV
jgi:hypothetical protein